MFKISNCRRYLIDRFILTLHNLMYTVLCTVVFKTLCTHTVFNVSFSLSRNNVPKYTDLIKSFTHNIMLLSTQRLFNLLLNYYISYIPIIYIHRQYIYLIYSCIIIFLIFRSYIYIDNTFI